MFFPHISVVNWAGEPYWREKARYKLATESDSLDDILASSWGGAIRGKRDVGLEGRRKITRLPVTDSTLPVYPDARAA